ncbi:MAG: RNB domain-containing ribonuclease [Gemmataceae bacterium]
MRDQRQLLWCSIDNDSSLDLDQLTVADPLPNGSVKILVAIADVDAVVKDGTPIDRHARINTTSVYTAAKIFPMLPERLSTDLTSLNEGEDRIAMVFEMTVLPDGTVSESDVYRSWVRNYAKLAYRSVAAWLDGHAAMPEKVQHVKGMEEQLRIQDRVAGAMKAVRYQHGALDLETIEPQTVVSDGRIVDLKVETKNRAQVMIEDFMIAANGICASFLIKRGWPVIQRLVRTPDRWDRIRDVARELGESLPAIPDSKALAEFLARRRQADPIRFADLSLAIVKLMGRGEYMVQHPGEASSGHFGLAVRQYSHSTAPNRRYPDLITQRLLKAALADKPKPYSESELSELATHCTMQEDAAQKVERQVRKSAASQFLATRIGERFEAIVTGASNKGTWVRTLKTPAEGRLISGFDRVQVGQQISVRLTSVNVEKGFIDFALTGNER